MRIHDWMGDGWEQPLYSVTYVFYLPLYLMYEFIRSWFYVSNNLVNNRCYVLPTSNNSRDSS